MTETKLKESQGFLRVDYLVESIGNFLKSVQNTPIAPLVEADKLLLIGRWSKFPKGENPMGLIKESFDLLSSNANSWEKIGSIRLVQFEEYQDLMQSLLLKVPEHFRSREVEYIHRMEQQDYPFFMLEVKNMLINDVKSAYKTADLLEKAMNIVKIKESDPLESRKIEDFQWSLIESKKILLELVSSKEEDVIQKRAKLEEIVHDLLGKILACEKTKRSLRELGLEEIMKKEVVTEKLPNGRVRLSWKKSG